MALTISSSWMSCTRKKNDNASKVVSEPKSALDVDALNNLDKYIEPQTQEEVAGATTGRTVDTGEDTEDLNIVLPQCGIPDFADSNAKTFSTQMTETYTRVINAGFAVANVDITSTLDLTGTLLETTLDVHVTHANSNGTSVYGTLTDVEPINQRALELTRKFKGYVTNYTVPNNSNFAKDWKGIVCTIRASDHLVNTRDGYNTTVDFYPPVAPAISPIADAARYSKELGDFRFFKNIKAKVTTTNNPVLTAGKEYTGSILVEKIPNERMTHLGVFKGDVAYRVTNRFGSDAETLALGFHLWTEYYIDNGQRAFSGIITNVGDEELRYFAGVYKGPAGVPANNVTYTKDIKPLITENCVSCHRPNNSPRLDLSTYAQVKAAAEQKGLIGRVLSGAMPPSGALANEPKKLFSAWSQAGFPE
jgi:mono/diheme cytochrome c family protein